MMNAPRRDFLLASAAATGGMAFREPECRADERLADERPAAPRLRIAPFRFDVTPPKGHSLCGGWIPHAAEVDDPLEAIGFVLVGMDRPIVICSVDWTGLLNEAHLAWRTALAEAAGTSPERVAVQCVHQHDAPFACLEAQRIVARQGDLPDIVDLKFFDDCLKTGGAAVKQALDESIEVTGIGRSQAIVDRVASNRRIIDLTGKVVSQRGSSSKDPSHHSLPEGLVDPNLKTIAFYNDDRVLVACHYYACHPMSYYGRGRVSSDFCGLARKQLQAEQPGCTHIYFNGCGGNIGAGKYNDGSTESRLTLTHRMHDAMSRSVKDLQPKALESCGWMTEEILPPPRADLDFDRTLQQVSDRTRSVVDRNRPSFILGWLHRHLKGLPIVLSGLHVNDISILHLPAECYIEYQLRAQASALNKFVACAAYGDGGPWYIPTRESYPQGGYSVGVAWCDPEVDSILSAGIRAILK